MTTFNLSTDVKTLTGAELTDLYQACIDKEQEISAERRRRDALPYVWQSQAETIKSIRDALSKPATVGADGSEAVQWQQPTSVMNVYIAGDTVAYKDATYLAVGKGAISIAPDATDPIQGAVWRKVDTAGGESGGDAMS